MDTKEIMVNEEVIEEATEKIANAGDGKALKVAGGVGLGLIVAYAAYRYVVKPLVAKHKAKKNQQQEEFDEVDDGDTEVEE